MTFGLSSTGFKKKRLADVQAEIEQSLQDAFGANINLLPQSVFGQLVGILSERESLLWELAEQVYNGSYPATAADVSLDNVASLTGVQRIAAAPSKVIGAYLFGDAGAVVPQGTRVSVQGSPLSIFTTDAQATLVAGVDEVQVLNFGGVTPDSGSFTVGLGGFITSPIPFSAAATDVADALNALTGFSAITVSGSFAANFTITFAGVDGKQPQPTAVVNSSLYHLSVAVPITVSTTTQGVAQAIVNMTCTTTGAVPAPTGTLTSIVTPTVGLSRVKNPTDAILGNDLETDSALRARRITELQVSGSGTVESIRARLLELANVTHAIVFENTRFTFDTAGRPPKCIECYVSGGDDQAIADLIWKVKGAGIATFGQNAFTVIDSQGISQQIRYSRPTEVPIWVTVNVTKNSQFPSNGAQLIEDDIMAYGQSVDQGQSIIPSPDMIVAIGKIPGVVSLHILVGLAPSPTSDANIDVAINEIAVIDTARIVVNVS